MKFQAKSSIEINAPLKKIRPLIEDFQNWKSWSPWSAVEPTHKNSFEGEAGKTGHRMHWEGEVIGSGQNTITENKEKEIHYELEFLKPWKSKSQTSFIFEEKEGITKVTWTMNSSLPLFLFFAKNMMKTMIEMDYERGLKMLKAIVEKGKINAKSTLEGINPFKGFSYVGIQKTSSMENMPKDMSSCFQTLMETLEKNGKQAQHWISIYKKTNMKTKDFTYIAAMSDENLKGIELPKNIIRGTIKSQNMFEVKHHGSYSFLGNAWAMAMMTVRYKKIKTNGKPFEYYWNNPQVTEEKDLKTSIFYPVK